MFKKIDLPYPIDALEPFVDMETVNIHYNKHHQGYVDKLNTLIESTQPELFKKDLLDLLLNIDELVKPENAKAVYNSGWQIINHNLFWENVGPKIDLEPEGKIAKKIEEDFGSFETFKQKFEQAANGQFGSGWTWLVLNQQEKLKIVSTSNADCPINMGELPLMVIDVWEHAYYLKYQNRRAEYVNAFWEMVNWDRVEKRYKDLEVV